MSKIKLTETETSIKIAIAQIFSIADDFYAENISPEKFEQMVAKELKFLVNSAITDCRNQLSQMQSDLLNSKF